MSTRLTAIAALALLAAGAIVVVLGAVDAFPAGPAGRGGPRRGLPRRGGGGPAPRARRGRRSWGRARRWWLAAIVLTFTGGPDPGGPASAIGCLVASAALAARLFTARTHLPPARLPTHPVVIWNPRSGGGKALAANLADEARARGIEPIELTPGADLEALVRDAVARGADGLAAAGGDGTQALVASVAAEHDLPFACIPAGTRNHFALDLGVDRDDVVGALDAFVNGGERRVDLAEVNGRTFVNNVSLGSTPRRCSARATGRPSCARSSTRRPTSSVPRGSSATALRWTDPDGNHRDSAAVILVSNNAYRLGVGVGSGTRPRVDAGELGIAVTDGPRGTRGPGGRRRLWHQWTAPRFEVDAAGPVPVGVDGEALVLDPPLRFTVRRGALRLRIAPHHPGASPSAALPRTAWEGLRTTLRIAAGRPA